MLRKNIVVIGAGHNGLTAAALLGKAGHHVTILEPRYQVGGAACTDTTKRKGFKLSKYSYLVSLMRKKIVEELGLERFGYEVLTRDHSSFTPLPYGQASLLLGRDMAFNQAQIAQFSVHDSIEYPRYEQEMGEIADWMSQMMLMIPPSAPFPRKRSDVVSLLKFARHILCLNPAQMFRLRKLLVTDPVKYLDKKHGGWFESDVLIATLLTDSLIGSTELSSLVLLHHLMGGPDGARGSWGYVRGGMGTIAKALAASCKEHGVKIVLGATAEHIVLGKNNRVSGVSARIEETVLRPETSRFFEADIVVSAINPTIMFEKLLKDVRVVDKLREKVLARSSKSGTMKINLTLKGVPNFRAMPGTTPGPQHQGTIHIAPSVGYILEALEDYQKGGSSVRPILEITIPSVVDDTLAPRGHHVMGIFLQYVEWEVDKEGYFWNVVMPLLYEHISNIYDIITSVQIIAPRDLESELGMIGGSIFHGDMAKLDQLWWNRPTGCADYRIPSIEGLYGCGAGWHPGGGVCGAAGLNAARVILADLKS